ncbi:MAG: LysM peptidoglycan-binding domain-containing protein [Bacillota bacterium]
MKKRYSGIRTGILAPVLCLFLTLFAGQALAAGSHTVSPGESLWDIASWYGVAVKDLKHANGLKGNVIYPGQNLKLPGEKKEFYTVKPGDTLFFIAKRFGTTDKSIKIENGLKSDVIRPGQVIRITVVQPVKPVPDQARKERPQGQVSRGGSTESISASEFDVLCRIITAEADDQSYLTKVAVGSVVLNRVRSPLFPDTIRGVVYQVDSTGRYQFEPVLNGWINRPASEEAKRAAKDALRGVDPSGGALYFWESWVTNKFLRSRPVSTVLGAFTFTY